MKTIPILALAAVTTALLTGGAFANDAEWHAIDNHHGVVTYSRLAPKETLREQQQTTVAVYANGTGVGRAPADVESDAVTFRHVTTPQGTITYTAPAK